MQQGSAPATVGTAPPIATQQESVPEPTPSLNTYNTPPRPLATDNININNPNKQQQQDFRDTYDYNSVMPGLLLNYTLGKPKVHILKKI